MDDERRRIGPGTVIVVAAMLSVVALAALGAYALGQVRSTFGLFDPGRGEYVESSAAVIESMRELATLTSVEVVEYTTIEKGDDRGILNFALGDRVYLFAVARIGAGVDLEQLGEDDVEVDFEERSIVVTVPPAEITYVALDNEETKVFDRDTGLFTRGDVDLESEARAAAEEILRQGAVDGGVLDEAELTTRRALRRFLTSLGFESVRIEQG